MHNHLFLLIFLAASAVLPAAVHAQGNDAKNPFPLAAPAGKDSNARNVAPSSAVNQGTFDVKGWKYGNAFPTPPGAKIWNPVKLKMMQGGKVVGGTVRGLASPSTYCAMADAGYDFIWTEMQHEASSWNDVPVRGTLTTAQATAAGLSLRGSTGFLTYIEGLGMVDLRGTAFTSGSGIPLIHSYPLGIARIPAPDMSFNVNPSELNVRAATTDLQASVDHRFRNGF